MRRLLMLELDCSRCPAHRPCGDVAGARRCAARAGAPVVEREVIDLDVMVAELKPAPGLAAGGCGGVAA